MDAAKKLELEALKDALARIDAAGDPARLTGEAHNAIVKDYSTVQSWCNADGLRKLLALFSTAPSVAESVVLTLDAGDCEFISKRLGRVAKLAGVSMPSAMTDPQIVSVAGTLLGDIARFLNNKLDALSTPAAADAREPVCPACNGSGEGGSYHVPMTESDFVDGPCHTCNGRGLVGGFVNAANGYDATDCPDCTPKASAPEPVESMAFQGIREHVARQMAGVHAALGAPEPVAPRAKDMAAAAAKEHFREFNALVKQPEPVALTDEPRAPKAFRAPEPGTPWWQTAKDCGAWTDRQDGDLGYIHFGSTEALRVYTMKISEQARQSALAASQPAPVEARPTDDALWDKTLKERDDYHEWADQLAARIATITGVGIGEHSSANHPWQNAVDAADEFNAGTRSGFTSQEIINACDAAGIDDRAYKRLMSVLKSSPVEAQAVVVPEWHKALAAAEGGNLLARFIEDNEPAEDAREWRESVRDMLQQVSGRPAVLEEDIDAAAPTPSKGEAQQPYRKSSGESYYDRLRQEEE